MVSRLACVLLVVAAGVARGDNAKLASARAAIEQVHFPEARALLAEALATGGSSPAEVREIYRLSASTAAALGNAELAEQFYRRWLALDPHASLAAGDSPKLRAPFVAAQGYIDAHGGLVVRVARAGDVDGRDLLPAGSAAEGRRGVVDGRDLLPAGSAAEGRRGVVDGRDLLPAGSAAERRRGVVDGRDLLPAGSAAERRRGVDGRDLLPAGSAAEGRRGVIDVTIVADPLAMAIAAASDPDPPVPFGADHHAHLPDRDGKIAIVDDHGNHLVELDVPAAAVPAVAPAPAPAPQPVTTPVVTPESHRWRAWAIPAATFTAAAIGFGVVALVYEQDIRTDVAESGDHFASDVDQARDRSRLFAYISAGAMAAGIGFAIPTVYFYPKSIRALITTSGIAVAGRF